MEDTRRVADYFVVAGLPQPDRQQQQDDNNLEVNLKPSHNQVGNWGFTETLFVAASSEGPNPERIHSLTEG